MDAKSEHAATLTLPSDCEIVLVRRFDAPKKLVFDAWSKPEYVKRWYGCDVLTLLVCEIDLREGGRWRWVTRENATGVEHALSGEYREIARPDRLVFTEVYEPVPGSDHMVTLTFDEAQGATTFTQRFLHPTKQGRDAHLQSGMERGIDETFGRLDGVLASMPRGANAAPAQPHQARGV